MAEFYYPQTYHIITFGCQMNEHDSEALAGVLENMGFHQADGLDDADIVLLNTCCVRETAENKVFSLLGRLRRLKKEKPDMVIGVSGCMSQQEGMAAKIRQGFPHVDLILGTGSAHEVPALIRRVLERGGPVLAVRPVFQGVEETFPYKRKEGIRAWVSIMYGCNNFCTYCIVPYVRGRERSRSPKDIMHEVAGLGRDGFKEVVLLGQNVNSYGKDLGGSIDFAGLLQQLDQHEANGVSRIRYMTSHPRDFSYRLIETIAASNKVCEHFHLPMQSGSNRILEKMNRGYTREKYLELVENIKVLVPRATISTDIMVGFPGEDENDFNDTLDLVRQVRFDSAYTFIYNPRPGTPAAKLEGQVPEEVKKVRIQELIKQQNKISLEKNKEEEGQIQEVLIEEESKKKPGMLAGKNRGNKTVILCGEKEQVGRIVRVQIVQSHLAYLSGRLLFH